MENIWLTVALIRKYDDGTVHWLGRLNDATETLRFVIAEREPQTSMRTSLAAEVAWQFDLDPNQDLLVSNMAQLNADFPDSVPAIQGDLPLRVSFFNVDLYRKQVRQRIAEDPQNHWLTSDEIWAGVSRQGLRIDPLIHQLITRSQVIRSWESSS